MAGSNVGADGPLTLWRDTIRRMASLPHADSLHLPQITEWITSGVQLDLVTVPPPVTYSNTLSVLHNADLVRARLHEYIEFGAVVRLPDDAICPFGIQPLHVIIKPDQASRGWSSTFPAISTDNLHVRVLHILRRSARRSSAQLSTPGCWFSKLDLSNCFLSFPLHANGTGHMLHLSLRRAAIPVHPHAFRSQPRRPASAPSS